jgi:hypothetical protein
MGASSPPVCLALPIPAFEVGGLLPPGRHVTNTAECKAHLVVPFLLSHQRPKIFDGWMKHRSALAVLIPMRKEWVGGSFTTGKAEPDDVDMASFFDGPAFDALPEPVRHLVEYMTARKITKAFWHCDSHRVVEYPVGSPGRPFYEAAVAFWEDWWGHTREDMHGVRHPRGYLEVQ